MSHRIHAITPAGPIIEVTICHLLNESQYDEKRCMKVLGLIDTGASGTCIDNSIAKELGLQKISEINTLTPSGSCMQAIYKGAVELENMGIIGYNVLTLTGADFEGQSIKALIGRDLLQHFTMIYNGWNNTFQLHI